MIRCTTVLDVWKCTMLISMKFVNIDTRQKLSNYVSNLVHTLLYTILHIRYDSMVSVLRNKGLNFRFYMYHVPKRGALHVDDSSAIIWFIFCDWIFWGGDAEFRKNSIPQKKQQCYNESYGISDFYLFTYDTYSQKTRSLLLVFFKVIWTAEIYYPNLWHIYSNYILPPLSGQRITDTA